MASWWRPSGIDGPKAAAGAFPASQAYVTAAQSGYADPDIYPIDDRGVVFTFAFFTPKRLGEGQFYLMVVDDKAGNPFDGARTYRLTVPADAPVRQYWSATVYDRETHALVREMPSRRPLVAEPGAAGECRRDGGHLLRAGSAGGQGSELGLRRALLAGSRSSSASMAPRNRCSRRPGCCPTSRRRLDRGGGSSRSAGVRVSARAFIVGAARSGSGKTSVAVGLMRALKARGLACAGRSRGPTTSIRGSMRRRPGRRG